MRTYRKVFPSLKQSLLSEPGNSYDVFIHTWETMGWFGPNDMDTVAISTQGEASHIQQLISPKRLVIEPNRVFVPPQHNIRTRHQVKPGTQGEHISSMYYKIKQCDMLRQQAECDGSFKYDIVVRARPDLVLERRLSLRGLIVHGRCVYTNDRGHSGGINDQFAIANSESMTLFSSCYDHLEEYVVAGCEWRPEPILLYHLHRHRFFIKVRPFGIHLLRPSGRLWVNKGNVLGRG